MMIYHMIWYVEINMLYEITMGNCKVVPSNTYITQVAALPAA